MSRSEPQIYCHNPTCRQPQNFLGRRLCVTCETPLIYRYLWALGERAQQQPAGTSVSDRYYVVTQQIWLDLQPGIAVHLPPDIPAIAQPYLQLYPQRLHVPEAYGFCLGTATEPDILLLDNAPITLNGELHPALVTAWEKAPAVRQVYWLWQILQLWSPLSALGMATSLLSAELLRVEGWRVRLRELQANPTSDDPTSSPTLGDLAAGWLTLMPQAKALVADALQDICLKMCAAQADIQQISAQLNQLLIEQAAQLPLQLEVFGVSSGGPQRSHNEDTCYPLSVRDRPQLQDEMMPRLAIVCDGIGGHEGGEVASQLAVQSIKLQVKALLAEVAEQSEPLPPELMAEQLAAIIRVVNNLIADQNDAQEREARRRMGTTLVMALQIPQRVRMSNGVVASNAHELYLVNVGDSRAYWITPRYCHQLTVDDDVASREVRTGRALYRDALRRPDSGSLTQALGTRDSQFMQPTVQRFVIEEDGLLLLCSDGLSDNDLVEQSWLKYAGFVLQDQLSLEAAAQSWLDLANQQNGHDNTSIVLTHCRVSSPLPKLQFPDMAPAPALLPDHSLVTPAASLIAVAPVKPQRNWAIVGGLLLLLLGGSAVGLYAWSTLEPTSFQQTKHHLRQQIRDRLKL
jgi:protein phosphatase